MLRRKIVFATNNAHKLEEARSILGSQFDILSLRDVGFEGDLPETGSTLKENALQKLEFFTQATGLDAFSDDTGLEVNCLGGAPGVDTAHYSGSRDAQHNMQKLLHAMSDCTDRSARFVTVIACHLKGETHCFEGEVKGRIGMELEGQKGFGYDPVFIPDGFNRPFAMLDPQLKNEISHRARAMQAFAAWLRGQ